MAVQPNAYSRRWFEFFHITIDETRTAQETEFICRCAPRPEFDKVLDVCCGMGRHARALSKRGYEVLAIDRDATAIAKAQELGGGPKYLVTDIRKYHPASEKFDLAIMMGQSFGHFDSYANRDILVLLATGIRKHGRIILDLWNPEFFVAHQGKRDLKTSNGIAREYKRVHGDRLFVQLDYPDGSQEEFEWQLFSPEQMRDVSLSAGLALSRSCSAFQPKTPPSAANPRIQFVLQLL
jgi:SAM-dependent methyltransferase